VNDSTASTLVGIALALSLLLVSGAATLLAVTVAQARATRDEDGAGQ
jgi:hypothetical protein